MFHIYDGRKDFHQWDLGQRLVVNDESCCEVHFCNKTSDCSLDCAVYEEDGKRLVDVPNILLQTAKVITAFTYVKNADESYTKHTGTFYVRPRSKPADYIYTETDVMTLVKAVAEYLTENPPKPGYTPIKGVDYFTAEDKAEMVNLVLASLPDGDEVAY